MVIGLPKSKLQLFSYRPAGGASPVILAGLGVRLLHEAAVASLVPRPASSPFMSKKVVTMTLNISEDSLSLSVYFKNIIPRMRPFRRNHPASLSLVLRQWYDFSMIDSCYPNIICPTNTRLFHQGYHVSRCPFFLRAPSTISPSPSPLCGRWSRHHDRWSRGLFLRNQRLAPHSNPGRFICNRGFHAVYTDNHLP